MKVPNRPDITGAVGKFTGLMLISYLILGLALTIIGLCFLIALFK